MSLVYKRLGAQGEIHLTENTWVTLCDLTCTHANWVEWPAVDDKYPQLCVDCLENRNNGGDGKEETSKKAPAKKVVKSTKASKEEKTEESEKSEKPRKKAVKKAVTPKSEDKKEK